MGCGRGDLLEDKLKDALNGDSQIHYNPANQFLTIDTAESIPFHCRAVPKSL